MQLIAFYYYRHVLTGTTTPFCYVKVDRSSYHKYFFPTLPLFPLMASLAAKARGEEREKFLCLRGEEEKKEKGWEGGRSSQGRRKKQIE